MHTRGPGHKKTFQDNIEKRRLVGKAKHLHNISSSLKHFMNLFLNWLFFLHFRKDWVSLVCCLNFSLKYILQPFFVHGVGSIIFRKAWFGGLGVVELDFGASSTGLFSSCVAFGKLLTFSVPQSSSIKWGLRYRVFVRVQGNRQTLRTLTYSACL